MTMTYSEARKLAILELLDDGISMREIADAGDDGYEGNLNDLIDALADRHLEEVKKKEAKEAEAA